MYIHIYTHHSSRANVFWWYTGASNEERNIVWFIGSDVPLFCRCGHLFFRVLTFFDQTVDGGIRDGARGPRRVIIQSRDAGDAGITRHRETERRAGTVLRRFRSYFLLDWPLSSGTTCIIRRSSLRLSAGTEWPTARHFWRATLSTIYTLSRRSTGRL